MATDNLSPRTIVKAPDSLVPGNASSVIPSTSDSGKENYEWVEIPQEDLFGETHTGVSINFRSFGPGKHFVDPETANEVRRLVNNRLRGDMRIMQPNQDQKMLEIMKRNGKGAPSGF